MEIIFVLVPVSLLLILLATWAFVWSVGNDQFENLDEESRRVLFEEGEPKS